MIEKNNMASELNVTRKWFIFITVGIGTFMSALDGSVVNTILPVIRGFFGSDVAGIEWTVVIYLLVVSCLLLLFGRFGDLHGHRNIYILGFLIFVASSAACGFASSVAILIVSRALQAIGASMLFANAAAILTKSFPGRERGRALGMLATMTYLGLAAGPSIGGWLAQVFGWRAVFYINVPIGLIAFCLSIFSIPKEKPAPSNKETFDVPGAVLFALGLGALLLAMNQGHVWGWGSLPVIGCFTGAAILLGAFLFIESRSSSPMLDLGLFRNRVFSACAVSAVLNYVCVASVTFLLPFYLIQGRGYTPGHAGLLLTSQPLVMAALAPLSGHLSDKIGSRLLSTLGMIILAIGLLLLAGLGPGSSAIEIIGYLAVVGCGTGIFISPNNSSLLGSAPRERLGIASGVLNISRNVGMVLGVGLAGAIFSTLTVHGDTDSLYSGIRVCLIVAACVGVVGAFVSSIRGNTLNKEQDSPSKS
jgi:EmrB/QacA subfamily drug resistance transporter